MTRLLFALSVLLAVTGCNPGPTEKPGIDALVGEYALSSESKKFLEDRKSYKSISRSVVTLRKDGTVSVTGLPDCYADPFDKGDNKFLTGQGRWEIENTDFGYGITLTIEDGGTLKAGIYHGSTILIKGRIPPFKLQFGIGDPDSDEFITYEKTNG